MCHPKTRKWKKCHIWLWSLKIASLTQKCTNVIFDCEVQIFHFDCEEIFSVIVKCRDFIFEYQVYRLSATFDCGWQEYHSPVCKAQHPATIRYQTIITLILAVLSRLSSISPDLHVAQLLKSLASSVTAGFSYFITPLSGYW